MRSLHSLSMIPLFALLLACGNDSPAPTSGNTASDEQRIENPKRDGPNALHREPPGPAQRNFPEDFPTLFDWEWGFELGGFGGVQRRAQLQRIPVIFVHGNTTDHGDWYVVRDDFRRGGWSDQELWALSYNGVGSNSGSSPLRSQPEASAERESSGGDGQSRSTNNDLNVVDLVRFIQAVQDYTGSACFSLVGHSLGVTLARKALHSYPELKPHVVAFVGIAGANHGTSLCPPGSETSVISCDEIARGTAWLEELNGEGGTMETYGNTAWLTIYDGSGVGDVAFAGDYGPSPQLAGADNREFPGVDHNGLRIAEDIVAEYQLFIEQAGAAAGGPNTPQCAM